MPKGWGLIGLKIRELFQKSGDLDNNLENILIGGMVMHRKPFNCLIILNNRVKALLLQLLPVTTQLVLVIRIEHE